MAVNTPTTVITTPIRSLLEGMNKVETVGLAGEGVPLGIGDEVLIIRGDGNGVFIIRGDGSEVFIIRGDGNGVFIIRGDSSGIFIIRVDKD